MKDPLGEFIDRSRPLTREERETVAEFYLSRFAEEERDPHRGRNLAFLLLGGLAGLAVAWLAVAWLALEWLTR